MLSSPTKLIAAELSGDGARIVYTNSAYDLLTIPSGTRVIRLLPPLNLTLDQAEDGIRIIEKVVSALA